MSQVLELDELLQILSDEEEGDRVSRLLETCQPLAHEDASPLLRSMLSSPEKWQRDVAADVANELGIDPFADEDEAEAVAHPEEPVIALGFDDDDSLPSTPPAGTDPVDRGAPDLVIGDEDEDVDASAEVTFLGCIEPQESGGVASGVRGATAPSARMRWIVLGVVTLAGLALVRYLSVGRLLP